MKVERKAWNGSPWSVVQGGHTQQQLYDSKSFWHLFLFGSRERIETMMDENFESKISTDLEKRIRSQVGNTIQYIIDELEVRDVLNSVVDFVDVGDAVYSLVQKVEMQDIMQSMVNQVEEIKEVEDELMHMNSTTDSVFDFTLDEEEVNVVMLHMVSHTMNPLSSSWKKETEPFVEEDSLVDREDQREAEPVLSVEEEEEEDEEEEEEEKEEEEEEEEEDGWNQSALYLKVSLLCRPQRV